MDNEDVILNQMEDTRTALSEKLGTLEQQVSTSVQDATSNVADTVEAVKDTVEAVKDSVQDTVEAVKDTVHDTVASVKESVADTICSVKEAAQEGWSAVKGALDVPSMVRSHPWAMFGGSLAAGYLLERMLVKPAPRRGAMLGAQSTPLPPDHYSGEERFSAPRPASYLAGLFKTFQPELNRLKGLALGTLMTSVRDLIINKVPENMGEKLTEIFNSVTEKLGGDQLAPESESEHRDRHHSSNGRRSERSPQEV